MFYINSFEFTVKYLSLIRKNYTLEKTYTLYYRRTHHIHKPLKEKTKIKCYKKQKAICYSGVQQEIVKTTPIFEPKLSDEDYCAISSVDYLFLPDKALSHYENLVKKYLQDENVNFVERERNPTNVSQARPIEDIFGYLECKERT